jgi:uncharacterized protein YegJ (DUF2314 family)
MTFASGKSQQINKHGKSKTFDENSVYRLDAEDKEMLEATELAKKTFSEFEAAIKSDNPDFKNFTLKKSFKSAFGDEHIWIKYIIADSKKNRYVGIVGIQPMFTEEVKYDDIVEIKPYEITDWMYFDKNNVVKGAYTLRLLRKRMSEKERKLFDKESGYIFE